MTLLALACVAAVSTGLQETDTLALRPEVGSAVVYDIAHNIVTDTQAAGMRFELTVELSQQIELRTQAAPADGPLEIDLTFRHVHGKMLGPFVGEIEFDSREPKESYPGLFDAKVRQLVMRAGQTVRLFVARDGVLQRVDGYAAIYAGTDIEEELQKAGDSLTDESFLEDAQMYFAHFSADAVGEGDEWETALGLTMFLNRVDLRPRYELEELTGERARLSFLATHTGEDEPPQASTGAEEEPQDAPEPDASGDSHLEQATLLVRESRIESASVQGQSVVSRSTGMLIETRFERIVGAKVPDPFGGDPLPSVVTQRTEIRQVKAAPAEAAAEAPPEN